MFFAAEAVKVLKYCIVSYWERVTLAIYFQSLGGAKTAEMCSTTTTDPTDMDLK